MSKICLLKWFSSFFAKSSSPQSRGKNKQNKNRLARILNIKFEMFERAWYRDELEIKGKEKKNLQRWLTLCQKRLRLVRAAESCSENKFVESTREFVSMIKLAAREAGDGISRRLRDRWNNRVMGTCGRYALLPQGPTAVRTHRCFVLKVYLFDLTAAADVARGPN